MLSILSADKLRGADKQALQRMIDNAEQIESAYAETNGYLTDIFGELGNRASLMPLLRPPAP